MVELKASNSFILLILPSLCIVKGDGSSLNCTFDDDFCLWKQDDSDDSDWAQHKVESYIYIKTSLQFPTEDKNARIISNKQRQSPFCLNFLYKMYGRYIGNLNVYMRTDDEDDNLIFTKERDRRNLGWQKAVIGENSNADFQIIIEGLLGAGIYGYIAIDDISMTYKFCSVDCNFNSGLCNWMQDNNDVLKWRLSRDGNYIYIETLGAYLYLKEYASLISPLMEEGKYCFSFWYHMYGKHTGTLIVKKAEQQKTTNELCVISGSEEARWIKKTIFIQSGTYFKVIIEGTFKDGVASDGYIAVDDVDVTSCQDCENPLKSDGRTNSSTFNYGSVIEVTCNSGYNLIGPSTLICQSGGIWSAPVTCEPIDCLMPKIANGIMSESYNYTTYNQTVDIVCEDGYDLVGNKSITCQADGYWSALPTCDLRDSMNNSDFTFVYVTYPPVAVALVISITAIVCRKKILRYFASRRQPGNIKKEHLYENQSHQHLDLSQGDENLVIADEQHEIGRGEIIEFSTIADAATTTVIEIQQYNNTKTNRVQVVDNVMKQTKGATKDCNHGYEQSVGETSTSEYYSLGPQSVDEKHYSVLMRDEEEIKADDGATKNEYEQIVEYYTLGQQSVDEKHYSVLRKEDNNKKANDGATDIEYEQPVGATPEYFDL